MQPNKQSNPFTQIISTGLMPIIKTNIKFNEEGIDAKFNLMDATPTERKNLNKLRQVLSIFHNFSSMNINKPEIKKNLVEISRVKQLTEGINSNEWIEEQLTNTNQSFERINIGENQVQERSQLRLGRMVSIPYNLTNQQSQLVPYIIFKYLTTQLSTNSLAVYYELNADEPETEAEDNKSSKVTKVTQTTIKIITSRYVFFIVAGEVVSDQDNPTTAGMIDIIEVRGNRDSICGFVTHPLEIIKAAANRTSSWGMELESKDNQNINLEEEYREFDKWFSGLSRGRTADLTTICNRSEEDNREGLRIDISLYNNKTIKILKALYDYTINNPKSFKATNNCIGFKWEVRLREVTNTRSEANKVMRHVKYKYYNIIIDYDFKYIYIFRKGMESLMA